MAEKEITMIVDGENERLSNINYWLGFCTAFPIALFTILLILWAMGIFDHVQS